MRANTRSPCSGLILLENIIMMLLIRESACHSIRDVTDVDKLCKNSDDKACRRDCKDPSGWNLLGSDWGCCGNYDGCCTYASFICYVHDALCRCCDSVGTNFCGPTCKPEPDCLVASNLVASTSASQPCKPGINCQATSGGDVDAHSNGQPYKLRQFRKLNESSNPSNLNNSLTKFDYIDFYNETGKGNFTSSRFFNETSSQVNKRTGTDFSEDYLNDHANEGSGETDYRPYV